MINFHDGHLPLMKGHLISKTAGCYNGGIRLTHLSHAASTKLTQIIGKAQQKIPLQYIGL